MRGNQVNSLPSISLILTRLCINQQVNSILGKNLWGWTFCIGCTASLTMQKCRALGPFYAHTSSSWLSVWETRLLSPPRAGSTHQVGREHLQPSHSPGSEEINLQLHSVPEVAERQNWDEKKTKPQAFLSLLSIMTGKNTSFLAKENPS